MKTTAILAYLIVTGFLASASTWYAAAEMAAYQAAQEAAATQPKRDRDAIIRQAVDDLALIRDSSGPLTLAQLSNAVRALAKVVIAMIHALLL